MAIRPAFENLPETINHIFDTYYKVRALGKEEKQREKDRLMQIAGMRLQLEANQLEAERQQKFELAKQFRQQAWLADQAMQEHRHDLALETIRNANRLAEEELAHKYRLEEINLQNRGEQGQEQFYIPPDMIQQMENNYKNTLNYFNKVQRRRDGLEQWNKYVVENFANGRTLTPDEWEYFKDFNNYALFTQYARNLIGNKYLSTLDVNKFPNAKEALRTLGFIYDLPDIFYRAPQEQPQPSQTPTPFAQEAQKQFQQRRYGNERVAPPIKQVVTRAGEAIKNAFSRDPIVQYFANAFSRQGFSSDINRIRTAVNTVLGRTPKNYATPEEAIADPDFTNAVKSLLQTSSRQAPPTNIYQKKPEKKKSFWEKLGAGIKGIFR